MKYADSTVFSDAKNVDGSNIVIEVPSSSGTRVYRVDLTNGRCSCPGWTRHANSDGSRNPCKHLRALGYTKITTVDDLLDIKEPSSKTKVTAKEYSK
jgi:predicted nucleic acid-binding Zn finger protein